MKYGSAIIIIIHLRAINDQTKKGKRLENPQNRCRHLISIISTIIYGKFITVFLDIKLPSWCDLLVFSFLLEGLSDLLLLVRVHVKVHEVDDPLLGHLDGLLSRVLRIRNNSYK